MAAGLGDMGLSMTLSAVGSSLGAGAAGMAAIGAWKRAYLQNKMAPFILVAFVGAPLTQTIYGMILRNAIIESSKTSPESYPLHMSLGFAAGLAIGMSAWMQGKAGASAADAMAETGKGFANYMIVLGIIETIAIFIMVFTLTILPK